MKHLWTAVALLTMMILGFGWNSSHLSSLIEPQQETLDAAILAAKAGEWERAEDLTRQAEKGWKESLFYLHLVQSHRDVDEITILLEESKEYAESQNVSTYCAMNTRIQGLMEGMRKMEQFSPENLM